MASLLVCVLVVCISSRILSQADQTKSIMLVDASKIPKDKDIKYELQVLGLRISIGGVRRLRRRAPCACRSRTTGVRTARSSASLCAWTPPLIRTSRYRARLLLLSDLRQLGRFAVCSLTPLSIWGIQVVLDGPSAREVLYSQVGFCWHVLFSPRLI